MSVVKYKHLIANLKHLGFAHEFKQDLCDQGLPARLHKRTNTYSRNLFLSKDNFHRNYIPTQSHIRNRKQRNLLSFGMEQFKNFIAIK